MVGKMIAEQRISGSIDQIDQIISFEVKAKPWDEHINVVCNKVCTLFNQALLYYSLFDINRYFLR